MSDAGRRSARIRDKRDNLNNSLTQNVFSEPNIGVEVQPVRKAKKAKTATNATRNQTSTNANPEVFRRTRGKRGLLEKLAKEAPLDILLEVFKHVEPVDVLHLARTSKDLRNFLMRRSSASIWREARENLPELPPLPFDLNEPQYASLLFDKHCQACLRSPCDNVIWQCRVRCHESCVNKLFFGRVHYQNNHHDIDYAEVAVVSEVTPGYAGKSDKRYWGKIFPASTFEHLLSQYKEIKGDESAVKAWMIQRRHDAEMIENHAAQCRIWEKNRREKRQNEQETLRNERHEQIVKRLSDLGWGPKELNHREFLSHPLVKPSKPLTERVWNNIEPKLVECLQVLKERRLEDEHRISLKSRYELLEEVFDEKNEEATSVVYPPLAEFMLDVTELKLCDDMVWNTPLDEQLVKADLVDALEKLDIATFAREWIKEKNQGLAELLQNGELENYQLSSVIFRCKRCGMDTWVPRIYTHRCSDFSRTFYDLGLYWRRWAEFRAIIYSTTRINEMMKLCGDPEPTTIEDLDQLDPLFEIVGTSDTVYEDLFAKGRRFARWTDTIEKDPSQVVLAICDEETKRQFLEKERLRPVLNKDVFCMHCPPGRSDSRPDYSCIREHLQTEHGIDPKDAKRNVDWCYRPEAKRLLGNQPIFVPANPAIVHS